MWTLPKGEDFLPKIPPEQLQELYESETQAKPKLRILATIHRKRGKSIDEIADILSIPRNTAYGWLRRINRDGIAAKDSKKQPGRPPALSAAQRAELVKELERGPPRNRTGLWTTKGVRELISRKFGIKYAPQHAWRILVNCGFSIQRPRPQHHKKASDEEIQRFKKTRDGGPAATERKDLLWARRTRRHSA